MGNEQELMTFIKDLQTRMEAVEDYCTGLISRMKKAEEKIEVLGRQKDV